MPPFANPKVTFEGNGYRQGGRCVTPQFQPQQNWLQLLETWKVKVSPSESYHYLRWWLLWGLKGDGRVTLACSAAG